MYKIFGEIIFLYGFSEANFIKSFSKIHLSYPVVYPYLHIDTIFDDFKKNIKKQKQNNTIETSLKTFFGKTRHYMDRFRTLLPLIINLSHNNKLNEQLIRLDYLFDLLTELEKQNSKLNITKCFTEILQLITNVEKIYWGKFNEKTFLNNKYFSIIYLNKIFEPFRKLLDDFSKVASKSLNDFSKKINELENNY